MRHGGNAGVRKIDNANNNGQDTDEHGDEAAFVTACAFHNYSLQQMSG